MRTITPPLRRYLPSPVMPRRAVPARPSGRRLAWWAACLVCGGLVGLVLAVVTTFRGAQPSRRRILLIAAGTAVQMVCAGSFAAISLGSQARGCPAKTKPEDSAGRVHPERGGDAWQSVRTVVNAPVSGAALLYGKAKGGRVYRCADNGTTAVVMDEGFARGGTMYGTVFLTDLRTETASPRVRRLSEHEARHSNQWAISALLAGPAAFPMLYSADEAFFPGAYNHFEREAGLADGGYSPPPDNPPAAGRMAFLFAGLLAGYFGAWSRRLRRIAQRPEPAPLDAETSGEADRSPTYAGSAR